MSPNAPEYRMFRGLSFFEGGEHIPEDLLVDLDTLRRWACDDGLVANPAHLLSAERIATVAEVCSAGDKPLIALSISGESGALSYREDVYLPVRALISRGVTIKVVSCRITPNSAKVRYRLDGCPETFCLESTAAKVVPRFTELLEGLAANYPVTSCSDGSREIVVSGHVRAAFGRVGRSFDVDLTVEGAG